MTVSPDSDRQGRYPEASRRTHFARERTLLAWWRTGVAVGAVALAIGGLLPRLGHVPRERFEALGVGYGVLALIFVVGGSLRDRAAQRAIAANSFAEVPTWAVAGLTIYLAALIVLSVAAFL
jgi:putative membrane protein